MSGSAPPIVLDLVNLPQETAALDHTRLEDIAKAASVVLERTQGSGDRHAAQLTADAEVRPAEIICVPIDPSVRAAWNDPDEATEWGAVAVAISTARTVYGREVTMRLPKGTGADFLTRAAGTNDDDGDERLECSGIGQGGENTRQRLREKLAQLARFPDQPPGRAIVTNFRAAPVDIMIGRHP